MEAKKTARVVEKILDKVILRTENEQYLTAKLSGNAKRNNSLLVGDMVVVVHRYDSEMIEAVLPRKNEVVRPPVANIDQMMIVVAITDPAPDYHLLDKQIILCEQKQIQPVICLNKMDLAAQAKEDVRYLEKVYGKLGIPMIFMSTKTKEGKQELLDALEGKITALSGNSGVGKSSLTSWLHAEALPIEIGEIGEKTKRGKHTTKYVKLYPLGKDTYLLDTPGFSSYELYGVTYKELRDFYTEFKEFHCDFDDCHHVTESETVCAIKQAVSKGEIDQGRYERYTYLFKKLKEQDKKKYK